MELWKKKDLKETVSVGNGVAMSQNTKKENVNNWNEEFSVTNEMVKSVISEIGDLYDRMNATLPEVGKLYGEFINFSDNFNKQYVCKMADSLIDVYMNIYKMHKFHGALAEKSDNENYKDAVSNYVDFMDMIEETLSVFGVEMIKSSVGAAFDGHIQEARNQNFNPANAVIIESIEPGFKYNGNTIKKEIVTVK